MTDDIWKRDELDSPCVKICIIHSEEKICVGCFRTIAEIINWTKFSAKERNIISSSLKRRSKKLVPRRRGGRKNRLKNQI